MRRTPVLVLLWLAAHVSGRRPNLVFILSDDLGYGDDSISPAVTTGSFRIPTPNIGRIASNGIKFVRGYSAQVCAPSRCTLMTGRHLGHCTIRGNDGAYSPLRPSDVTVAAVLKQAGYRTGVIGKWGLGNFGTSGYPLKQGFDYFVGQDTQVGCHDWYPLTVCNNTGHSQLNRHADLQYSSCLGPNATCTWANDLDKTLALNFIRESAALAAPFFLYLSTTTPHAGFLQGSGPTPTTYASSYPVPYPYNRAFEHEQGELWSNAEKQFAAAVVAQDLMVGAVLDELEKLRISNHTVVFFSGDNGPECNPTCALFDDSGFFRGKKRSLHEGGIRQTIAVQWPSVIRPMTVTRELFSFYDLLPTAAEIAGVPRSQWPVTDGISALPVFEASGRAPKSRYL